MWNSLIASSVKNGLWKIICTYFLNAHSVKASGGPLAWNGTLTWTFYIMIADAKNRYSHNIIMEILITGCWSIWEQRNDAIFRGI
jgi:hypothetical protein